LPANESDIELITRAGPIDGRRPPHPGSSRSCRGSH